MSFLQASLSSLADDLKASQHDYAILKQSSLVLNKEGTFSRKKFEMLLQKGIFPYSFCTSIKKMKRTTKLPSACEFYSELTQETISQEEHDFAKKVWRKFNCANLLDYCLLYCQTDTLLLAEVMQKFRQTMHDFTGVDPSYYISLPSFAWDAMLRLTKTELESFTDIDQCLFTELGIRGGLSFIGERHCQANEQTKIYYIDANNLYGYVQQMKLPKGDFKWVDTTKIVDIEKFISDIDVDGSKGYLLCVDLLYPEKLHKKHAEFPLAPHCLQICYDDLSPYAKKCLEGETTYKSEKLVASFLPKKKYVLHIKNLKLYLQLGMKLKKVHKILEFTQEAFLKPYIDLCTEKRQKACNKFEKNLFKLMCNSGIIYYNYILLFNMY